jgi:choline dehydrogenase-like flavoprotein
MVYMRGQPRDFDDWARSGLRGWSYRDVLPYFIRSESNPEYAGSPYHGTDGPMRVAHIRRPNPLNAAFLAAMDDLGFPRCHDFNDAAPEGYGPRQGTIRDGRRESTASAYLAPALRRGNLRLLTDTLVRRVVLAGRRATGVEVEAAGAIRQIRARAEIIVCGGSILSPKILLLSGIGDGEALRRVGIDLVHHLPAVGANLHDHLAAAVLMEMRDSTSYGISVRAAPRGAWNLLEYALMRRGPFASNVFESTAFLRLTPEADRPNVQIVFQPARRNRSAFPLPLGHGFAISAVALYPKSRGRVSLASRDPHLPPDIDPNLLGVAEDIVPLLRGLELGRRIVAASPFRPYHAVEVGPGPAAQGEAALADYIRRTATTVHHPVSTCRMGSDAGSVVDGELRVRGIEGLRVADASVFPSIIGGNTNATVVVIAEKAADMILGRAAPAPIDVGAEQHATATSEA